MSSLEVIVQCDDVWVTARDSLENCDLIADHMFATLHEFLVDNFACIVFSSLDVDGLFHNSICTAAKGATRPVLAGYCYWLRWRHDVLSVPKTSICGNLRPVLRLSQFR